MSPQWDFLQGIREGYIPNPVTNRSSTCQSLFSRDDLTLALGDMPSGMALEHFDAPTHVI